MNLDQFFHMGGYGIYVWPAYGITLLVFLLNLIFALKETKSIKKNLKQYFSQVSQK